jgi:phage baseplate assembly protein W
MAKRYFVGFSTVDNTTPPFSLTDIELVKRDILNQFQTIKGERVMLPAFGSDIPLLLMNPLDEITIDAIISDAITVVSSEPRVSLVDIQQEVTEQSLLLNITLYFIPQAVQGTLFVQFDLQTQEAY